MSSITLEQQIACVARELALRKNVYPGFVARGKMKQEKADAELFAMQAVMDTLKRVQAADANQCDGCRRGAPLKDGIHELSGTGSYPGEKMACTRDRYTP